MRPATFNKVCILRQRTVTFSGDHSFGISDQCDSLFIRLFEYAYFMTILTFGTWRGTVDLFIIIIIDVPSFR